MKPSETRWTKRIIKWSRAIHRNLGYLVAGLCLVYGISGILLNHMGKEDPAFHTEEVTLQLQAGLGKEELENLWNSREQLPSLRRVMPIDESFFRLMLDGGIGIYNKANGTVDYEIYTKRPFVYWINKLHYNKVKGWSVVADFFAAALIFLALSGLIMVRGKRGIAGRGKWYLLAGLLLPVLYVIFS